MRFERVTNEEVRMIAVEALKAVHGVENQVGDRFLGVHDTLKVFENRMKGVEGMQGVGGDKLQGVNNRVADTKSELLDATEFEKETDNVIQFSVSARAIPRVLVHDLTPSCFPFTRTRTNSKFIVSVSYIPVQHSILLTSVW